jgi:DNA-binding MarR family transcriptional regulator
VGEILGIQRANMVALVGELIGLGYIEREAAADRRAFALHATGEGVRALEGATKAIGALEAEMLSLFNAEERAVLFALVRRLEGARARPR